jgi:hypothetical protein
MIRTDVLRAKTLRSEILYLSDLKTARQYAETEAKKRADLDQSTKNLWSELSRVGSALQTSGAQTDSPKISHEYGKIVSTELQRLQQAQEKMVIARRSHKEATADLSSQMARASSSRERITLLEKMIAKSEIQAKTRAESNVSDELSELIATNRAVRSLRIVGGESNSLNNSPQCTLVGTSTNKSETRPGELPTRIDPSPRIERVGFSNVADLPMLSIKCSLGHQAPLSLSIAKDRTGDLKVVIEQGFIRPTLGAKGESELLKARLSALGLKIGSIEWARSDSDGPKKGRAKRTVLEDGEQDEIAVS